MPFQNREHAGHLLADRIRSLSLKRPIVLALPRGGVPIGFEIASTFHAPLDVFVVRKVGAPGHAEYGIGAVAENGFYWIDPEAAYGVGATSEQIEKTRSKVDEVICLEEPELFYAVDSSTRISPR